MIVLENQTSESRVLTLNDYRWLPSNHQLINIRNKLIFLLSIIFFTLFSILVLSSNNLLNLWFGIDGLILILLLIIEISIFVLIIHLEREKLKITKNMIFTHIYNDTDTIISSLIILLQDRNIDYNQLSKANQLPDIKYPKPIRFISEILTTREFTFIIMKPISDNNNKHYVQVFFGTTNNNLNQIHLKIPPELSKPLEIKTK